jgi:diacylglycerol kinase family enzyme
VRIQVILNGGGGTLAGADSGEMVGRLRSAFEAGGVDAEIDLVEPDTLSDAFERAAKRNDLDAIVAGGGDGTISSAASALAGGGTPLAILPLGTLNHLARDAGIPSDLEEAAKVIAAGNARPVDIAEVNGRIFVNNSAIGLYPHFVRAREAQQRRLGRSKRLAMLFATVRALRHFPRNRLAVTIDGKDAHLDTPLLFIGNNVYDTSLLTLGQRSRLDGGELCLYAVLAPTRLRFLWLGIRALFGRLDQERDFFSAAGIKEIVIGSRHDALPVAMDGETETLQTPLRYRVRPAALRLIVPTEDQAPAR